jgi:hypothetical protein
MTTELSEWRIVRRLAEQVCKRVTRKVIRALQGMNDGLQSGDDSGLINTWEEICAQSQVGESDLWEAYDETLIQVLSNEVAKLQEYERDAVWLQTPQGERWDADDEDSRRKYPVAEDDIVEYPKDGYVYSAASDWTNKRIRKYVEQNI